MRFRSGQFEGRNVRFRREKYEGRKFEGRNVRFRREKFKNSKCAVYNWNGPNGPPYFRYAENYFRVHAGSNNVCN